MAQPGLFYLITAKSSGNYYRYIVSYGFLKLQFLNLRWPESLLKTNLMKGLGASSSNQHMKEMSLNSEICCNANLSFVFSFSFFLYAILEGNRTQFRPSLEIK